MRQLLIEVPRDQGKDALEILKDHGAVNMSLLEGTRDETPIDLIIAYVSNRKVERVIDALDGWDDLRLTLSPHGMMPLRPPSEKTAEQVTDVSTRSPIEVFLGGLQSIGSWRGFTAYAVAAGVIVWVGLTTNTVYLLIAAMLIAPYAGPVMNTAIATARGDARLLGRSILRYCAGLLFSAGSTAFLTFMAHLESPTALMVDVSKVSATAILLPMAAGAAGALNIIQSERDSLVSGAAVGMLVAASLALPAGLVGITAIIGRFDMLVDTIFVLLLQLIGINLAGSLVFRLFGLSSSGARYPRGRPWIFPVALLSAIVVLGGLVTWQWSVGPDLHRPTIERMAETAIEEGIRSIDVAVPIEVNARFTRPQIERQRRTLLVVAYVKRKDGGNRTTKEIASRVADSIRQSLLAKHFQVTPVVQVNVLDD
jgi:uncharacterized membrane protein